MKTSQILTMFSLGATLILAPGSQRIASADPGEHPVFKENPGKHKGWDKHDKEDKHDKRYEHVADARHERLYPHTVTRTSTGYWHSHDGYPRHFHYYRTPAPIPPHQHVYYERRPVPVPPPHHVRREVVVVEKPVPVYKPVIRRDAKAIQDARTEIRADRDQQHKNYTELQKDRGELRRDIRSGASKDEITKDRNEIRDDRAQIRKTHDELAADRARLNNVSRK